jgi:hypothetical protein
LHESYAIITYIHAKSGLIGNRSWPLHTSTAPGRCSLAHHAQRWPRWHDDVSSITGILPFPQFANYSATKARNRYIGESLHGELRADGVDVVSLCAGRMAPSRVSSWANQKGMRFAPPNR